MLVFCAWCNTAFDRPVGHVNRSRAQGNYLYCGRECSGLGRRKGRTDDEKRSLKAAYDAERRTLLADELRAAKRKRHLETYDPEKARIERAARMPRHVEYCRQPEYVAWKKTYDRNYRCKREYGPFWEAASTLFDLEAEVHERATDYEIRTQNGTLNKRIQRRRDDDRTQRQ